MTSSSAHRVRRWLLEDGAQIAYGPHRGGVCGWLDASGRGQYVYPEITGYFLQWLAWLVECGHPKSELAPRAQAAQAWLRRWAQSPPLRMRVYLLEPLQDWRNAAVFSFDLSMALRGVASATRMGLVKADDLLVGRLAEELAALRSAEQGLDAYKPLGEEPVPVRWSTRPGAFMAKAAAGIIAAHDVLGLSDGLVEAAERAFVKSLEALHREPPRELHALLYGFEGALALPARDEFHAELDFAHRALSALAASGSLPGELADGGGRPRLDVRAQFVRLCCMVEDFGAADLPGLVEPSIRDLEAQVTAAGAVPFDPTAVNPQYNVWCAMFAEQAFVLANSEGEFNPAVAAALLV